MVYHTRQCRAVFAVMILFLVSSCMVYAASAQSTIVTAEASSGELKVGDTLTVTVKVADAVDLYGVDLRLSWNTAVLEPVSAVSTLGVESNSNGVLHQSANYPIDVISSDIANGEYHLLATSTGETTPSFSGSGTIATVIFNVTGVGQANLSLNDVELSMRDSSGEISLLTPQTDVSVVNTVIPEFPVVALILALAVAAAAVVIFATKKVGKPQLSSITKNVNHV